MLKRGINMNECNEKLKEALLEAMRLDNEWLEKQIENCEPHVFSEEFERKMQALLVVKGKETDEKNK